MVNSDSAGQGPGGRRVREYNNRRGNRFNIEIETAPVPEKADYWGFIFRVRELATNLSIVYRVMIKRSEYKTLPLAEHFVTQDPLAYLKSTYLDNYEAGSHPLFWPNTAAGWIVI